MKKYKILIVGSGYGQIPVIKEAKKMGLTVISIDKNKNSIGRSESDLFFNVDVTDFDGALSIAKKYNIDAVFTMQTDIAVPTVGYIIDELNLIGSGLATSENCSNKIKTRLLLKSNNVNQPKFAVIEKKNEIRNAIDKIGYPCVFKAPDSSGSRGIVKVDKFSDVNTAFDESMMYTSLNKILIEEYIEGIEIGAQAFSVDGKCVKVLLHDDYLSNKPYMIPVGHSFPIVSLSSEQTKIVEKTIISAVESLGISNGPSNIDLILDNNNEAKIIEIGARIGATCLPELVFYHTGINWVRESIKNLLGFDVDLKNYFNHSVAAFILKSEKDGILRDIIIPDTVLNDDQVLEIEVTASIGDKVHKLRKGTDRIGKIIFKEETNEKIYKKYKELTRLIKFHIN